MCNILHKLYNTISYFPIATIFEYFSLFLFFITVDANVDKKLIIFVSTKIYHKEHQISVGLLYEARDLYYFKILICTLRTLRFRLIGALAKPTVFFFISRTVLLLCANATIRLDL